jgi:hypothetical protein
LSYKKKPIIVLVGRVYPGEANGSFVMQGFIKYITSSNPTTIELRKQIIFKIIPMLNIDGVIVGNSRACITGQDLNKQFTKPNPLLHPEICALKNLISNSFVQGHKVLAYIEFRSNNRKKCVFMYGPHYPLHSIRYLHVRVLPKLLSGVTQMFRYRACRFREEKSNPGRQVVSKVFDIVNSYSIEVSSHAFIDARRVSIEFSDELYETIGRHTADALFHYYKLVEEEENSKVQRVIGKGDLFSRLQKAKKGVMDLQDVYKSIKSEIKKDLSSSESDVNENSMVKEEEMKTLKRVMKAVSGFYPPASHSTSR